MATNQIRYVGNIFGAPGPHRVKLLFKSHADQAIKRGELLEPDSGSFVPLATDKAMSGTVAISDHESLPGDLAGYRSAIIPRDGDLFAFALDAEDDPQHGDALYVTGSQEVTTTVGTNILGYVASDQHIPEQGHVRLGDPDAGVTRETVSQVFVEIKKSVSLRATRAA